MPPGPALPANVFLRSRSFVLALFALVSEYLCMAHMHITLDEDLVSYAKSAAAWSRPRKSVSAFMSDLLQAHRDGADPRKPGSDQAKRLCGSARDHSTHPPTSAVVPRTHVRRINGSTKVSRGKN
jgi:hypothetical protein